MSDWYGTESTAESIQAGLDIEMPGPSKARGEKLINAIELGKVDMKVIDERVSGILKMVRRTAEVHSTAEEQVGFDATTNILIKKIALESMVLLKNDHQALPIDVSKGLDIAVVGQPAIKYCGGGGSASGLPQYYKTPLDSIRELCGDTHRVSFSPGVRLHRCTPMADPSLLTSATGNKVEVSFYKDTVGGLSDVIHREQKYVPLVFILGHVPEGLSEKEGFVYEMTTNITAKTSGRHTLAVLATGAFRLLVEDHEILSQGEPEMSVEDFLFLPHMIEKQCQFTMEANRTYSIKLITKSRRQLNEDEPTPHSSKLCFVEEFSDEDDITAAGEVAANNDVSIVFAGRNNEWEQEGSDMDDITLPKQQNELIKNVALNSKTTIVVLFGGNPFDVRQWVDQVDAVLFVHFPGQEGGAAIADILFGKAGPSGRLPMTWPFSLEDIPANKNFPCRDTSSGPEIRYEEELRIGYRHFWSSDHNTTCARWDFGYGLSYTTFEMEALSITESEAADKTPLITVDVAVQNTGTFPGAEVVQVYVEDAVASVWRPAKELKAFEKVFLQPGEKVIVSVVMLRQYALSFWSREQEQWCAEQGEFIFHVGQLKASYVLDESFSWDGL